MGPVDRDRAHGSTNTAWHRAGRAGLKAIVQRRYGSPDWLELRDLAKPVDAETDVLVRVHAVSVNAADWHFLTGIPYVLRPASGILRPRRTIPGRDLAGRVERSAAA